MGNVGEEQSKLFTTMKKGYDLRSKVIHGNMNGMTSEGIEVVTKLEQILKQVILRWIDDKKKGIKPSANDLLFK